jgi:putative SOS response-associated peptidase YedK
MCGRFYLDAQSNELETILGLSGLPELRPRFNIVPSQPILAAVATQEGRVGRWFRWWLIPAWAKDDKIGYRTLNARAETVATKPAFRAAFRRRRCLIPASGHFEWRSDASGKQPYGIHPTDAPLLVFAGLYEHWQDPQGEGIDSCTILVTDATPSVVAIHDRMPLCLAPAQFATWLDPAIQAPAPLQALIDAAQAPALTAYPIIRRMNHPRYDQPDAITPLTDPYPGRTRPGGRFQ